MTSMEPEKKAEKNSYGASFPNTTLSLINQAIYITGGNKKKKKLYATGCLNKKCCLHCRLCHSVPLASLCAFYFPLTPFFRKKTCNDDVLFLFANLLPPPNFLKMDSSIQKKMELSSHHSRYLMYIYSHTHIVRY